MVVFSSRLTLLDNMIEGTGFAHDKISLHNYCHYFYHNSIMPCLRYSPCPVLLIGISYRVYLGAVISAIILVVLAVSVIG